jgi:malyl-CoA/(S)-citramalyl-CoA lyase
MVAPRLHRSELAVPGCNVRMLERAPDLGADVVMLDLEDAVAPDDKEHSRANVIDALRDLDWSRCSVSVRINGLDTQYCYRDIVDVVEAAGDHIDTILTPHERLIERTHRIVAATREAAAQGKGAVSLDGRLIDAASIRMAENLLAKLELIEQRQAIADEDEAAPRLASA